MADPGSMGAQGSGTGTASGSGNAAREAMEQAGRKAAGLADQATAQGRTLLTRQKEAAAGHVTAVADALRRTAGDLERDEPQAGRYVGYAAERLDSLGRRLRDRDLGVLVGDAQRMARRAPGAVFAGSVIAGFMLARFMKASAADDDRHRPGGPSGAWTPGDTGVASSGATSGSAAGGIGGGASTGGWPSSASPEGGERGDR